jgi:general secretion pathway protein C
MVNRIFTLANLLLVAIAAYFAVAIFYAIVTAGLDVGPAPAAAVARQPEFEPEPAQSPADYRIIVERNLFKSGNQAIATKGAPGPDIDKLKETDLKVKLWGTVFGQDGRVAAVIEDQKTREQMLYRPGDSIQNASIKMVLREKVVLTVDGRDEVLSMEEPGVAKAGAPMAAARPPGTEAVQQVTVPEEQVEKAMENLSELMTQATFRPYLEDGHPAGISITGIKPNAIFRRLRLRNGDVITGVNGQQIESVEDAMRVFGSLTTEGPMQVSIKRRGRDQTLEYKIE